MKRPISRMDERQINSTLHGRSISHPHNRTGHNVLWGWTHFAQTGEAIGEAIDLATYSWGESIYACFDGTVIRWAADTEKLEHIYLQSDDGKWLAVYAHIDYASHNRALEKVGQHFEAGEQLGTVRTDLNWDHLHFELVDLQARSGRGRGVGLWSSPGSGRPDQILKAIIERLDANAVAPDPMWYASAMDWAKNEGLLDGTRGGEPMLRGEAAEMLRRYHNLGREP